MAETNPEIRKAVDTLYELSADEKVRAEYEMRQKAWRDRASQIGDAFDDGVEIGVERGIEKGVERGVEKGRHEVARNALAEGFSLETIRKITGLDVETIKALQTP